MEKEQKVKNIHSKMPLKENGICVNCYQKKDCNYACFGEEVLFCDEYSFRDSGGRKSRYSGFGQMDFSGFNIRDLIPGWK